MPRGIAVAAWDGHFRNVTRAWCSQNKRACNAVEKHICSQSDFSSLRGSDQTKHLF
jgi:hypothetical protein